MDKCPECHSIDLISDYDNGEIVCRNCGLVLAPIINTKPEWRSSDIEEEWRKSRVGAPQSLSFQNKGSILKPIGRDFSDRKIKGISEIKRLSKRQEHSIFSSAIERNLVQAMEQINLIASKLNAPWSSKETAAMLYRKALKKGLIHGRSIKAMICACLYAAFRLAAIPRSLKEIVQISGLRKKEISHCYSLLLKALDMKMPLQDPISYIPKISQIVGLSEKIQTEAIEIINSIKNKKIRISKNPIVLAAAALYVAYLENEGASIKNGLSKINQRTIANAAGITEMSVRHRYKELVRKLNINLPERANIRSFF